MPVNSFKMVSESDKCILSKDMSSIASMADVLVPKKAEIPKIYIIILSIGINHINPYI